MASIKATIDTAHYKTVITSSKNQVIADEPIDLGGEDLGFAPDELLCSALASCTAITLRMYADRKAWDLQEANIHVSMERDSAQQNTKIVRKIELIGNLDATQRERLLSVANACPVHKVLSNPILIESSLLF